MRVTFKNAKKQRLPRLAQDDQVRVLAAFQGPSKVRWPPDLQRRYFYEIREQSNATRRDVPENAGSKAPVELFRIVRKYDVNLQVFQRYYAHAEEHGQKIVELYKVPKGVLPAQLLAAKPVAYDLRAKSDQWEVIGAKRDNKRMSFSVARMSHVAQPVTIDVKRLRDSTIKDLRKVGGDKVGESDSIDSCKLHVAISQRHVAIIDVEPEEGYVQLARPMLDLESDSKADEGSLRDNDRGAVLAAVFNYAEIATSPDELGRALSQNPSRLLSGNTFDRLYGLNQDKCLVIRTTERYDRPNEEEELSEEVTSRLKKYRAPEIEKTVKEYYEKNKSLRGYFLQYTKYDSQNATTISELAGDSRASSLGYKSLFFFIREPRENEKVPERQKLSDGKVIESLRFSLERSDQTIKILDRSYSGETYDALISEIRRIAEGSS